MKAIWVVVLAAGLLGCQGDKPEKIELNTEEDKTSYSLGVDVGYSLRQNWEDIDEAEFARGIRDALAGKDVSYALGVDIGRNMKMQEIEANVDILARGVRDAMTGRDLQMAESEIRDIMVEVQKKAMARQQELTQKRAEEVRMMAEENRRAGEEFLAQNSAKAGVVTLPNGLQYRVMASGSGGSPTLADTVTAIYSGRKLDGTEFDNSERRGGPMDIPIGATIAGWKAALQLMKVGDKWEIYVPSKLAYGNRGQEMVNIGPNEALIFQIELLGIKEGQGGAPAPGGRP